jgi:ABC-type polysaccharide/polyol phosphate transport system ATPase subunit
LTATASQPAAERKPVSSGAPPAVSVEGVSKRFRLPHEQYHTLKERALHPFASRNFDELHAVENVTFDVAEGEFFGIVGRNGSGKSTLLKCLAGIYGVDDGRMSVRGRLSPFIELGVGFNQELTARDNVIINAIMLGLTRKQARERFDEIIAFAELEEFVDLKLKNYSSGMSVRLGFAVAVQVDADVLLVDEVLAVGDAAFQQKCFDQFDRMKAEGRTILFVTHDMGAVRRFCDRAMLLERGDMLALGDPEDISRKYGELNFGVGGEDMPEGAQAGEPVVRVHDAWCENERGERIVALEQGERCVACFDVEFVDSVQDPIFEVIFRNEVKHTIFVPRSDASGPTGSFAAGEHKTVRLGFPNWLAASRYVLTPAVLSADGRTTLERRPDYTALLISAPRETGGVADLPVDLEVRKP